MRTRSSGVLPEQDTTSSALLPQQRKKNTRRSASIAAPDAGQSSGIRPTLSWQNRVLDDKHFWVQILNPDEDDSSNRDKDPFGGDWFKTIPEYLLDSYIKPTHLSDTNTTCQVAEVFSAKRVDYSDKYEYHFFFNIVGQKTYHHFFAAIEIARSGTLQDPFVLKVRFCDIMPSPYDYNNVTVCRFCAIWVPHPKEIKTFSPPQDGYKTWLSFETRNGRQFRPDLKPIPRSLFCNDDHIFSNPDYFDTGLGTEDDVQQKFVELKENKTYRFIVFKIRKFTMWICVETVGQASATLEDLADALPADDCRYAVINYEFMTKQGVKNKFVFVEWSRDTAKDLNRKRAYFGYKNAFVKELNGIEVVIKATCRSNLTSKFFNKKCQ